MMLGFVSTVWSAPQLESKYTICYGNPKAPIHIVEYFSFGCASCLRIFAEEFDGIRETYIKTGRVYWVMHPHPVDVLTVQAMVCLEGLSDHQKRIFLEAILLEHYGGSDFGLLRLMKAAMDVLKVQMPDINDSKTLQATTAFKAAFAYQQAKPTFSGTPTLYINGKLIDEFPTRTLIDELIQTEEGKS
jgi:protein-disulfide isomerase